MRAVLSAVLFVVLTLIGALLALPAGLVNRSGDRVLDLARLWARSVLWAAGVRFHVHTRGQLVPGRPYVFMANHASAIDIWMALVAIPVQFRFIAKKQLGAIPLFGWAMRAGRFIFIDRQNPALARKSIDEAAHRIRAGQSVVMFPEGTRTRDGRVGPFKKGGFHLAMDSGAEIVPMAISGARALMPRGRARIHPGEVSIEIDDPISVTGLGARDRDALVERVRARIIAMLGEQGEEGDEREQPESQEPGSERAPLK